MIRQMQQADAAWVEPRGEAGGQKQSGRRVGPCLDRRSLIINKKNKKTEDEKKVDGGGGNKNGGSGGEKREEKKRRRIDGSVQNQKEGDDYANVNS